MKVKLFQETQQRSSIFKVPGVGMNLEFSRSKKKKSRQVNSQWSVVQPPPTGSPEVPSSAQD